MSTVGAFLKEKAENMKAWLHGEIPDLTPTPALTELTATTIATKLAAERQVIYNRDWGGLERMTNTTLLSTLGCIIQEVRARPFLHDKFWRYLELFVETVKDKF